MSGGNWGGDAPGDYQEAPDDAGHQLREEVEREKAEEVDTAATKRGGWGGVIGVVEVIGRDG